MTNKQLDASRGDETLYLLKMNGIPRQWRRCKDDENYG